MEAVVALTLMVAGVSAGFVVIRSVARVAFGRRRRLEEEISLRLIDDRERRGEIDREQATAGRRAVSSGRD